MRRGVQRPVKERYDISPPFGTLIKIFLVLVLTNSAYKMQVKLKVSRSLKLMRSAAIHTRKLARDMLIFWKRVDKEQVSISFLNLFTRFSCNLIWWFHFQQFSYSFSESHSDNNVAFLF